MSVDPKIAIANAFGAAATGLKLAEGIAKDARLAWMIDTAAECCNTVSHLSRVYRDKVDATFIVELGDSLTDVFGTLPSITRREARQIANGVEASVTYIRRLAGLE